MVCVCVLYMHVCGGGGGVTLCVGGWGGWGQSLGVLLSISPYPVGMGHALGKGGGVAGQSLLVFSTSP